MNEFKAGDRVIVEAGSVEEKSIALEGLTGTIIKVLNTIATMDCVTQSGQILTSTFVIDGRMGTKVRPYERADEARELKANFEYKKKEFKKYTDEVSTELRRLSFASDENYAKSLMRDEVLGIVRDAGKK